jgi:deazaflavin-dependent oxidoreductase (nitroreductase family)
MEHELAAWGKAIVLEARGRRSGLPRRVTIGFAESGDDLLVAAASEGSHWARNLDAEPRCHVELRGVRRACRAQRLAGAEAEAAVVALILKYGTPAERLSGGPAFRLSPA